MKTWMYKLPTCVMRGYKLYHCYHGQLSKKDINAHVPHNALPHRHVPLQQINFTLCGTWVCKIFEIKINHSSHVNSRHHRSQHMVPSYTNKNPNKNMVPSSLVGSDMSHPVPPSLACLSLVDISNRSFHINTTWPPAPKANRMMRLTSETSNVNFQFGNTVLFSTV